MASITIKNNRGTTIQVDQFGNIKINGNFTIFGSTNLESVQEDAPTNSASGGAVAGIGVGPKGEPGKKPKTQSTLFKILKRKMVK